MREKNIQGVFNLESLMKRQLAALVHCVRRTALMRVTDMTGTMTKRIAGGIINASIIMKNMPCHNRKHSRYGKNKKELLVILSLKDDKENRDIVRLHHVVCIWMIIKILQMELMEIRDSHLSCAF